MSSTIYAQWKDTWIDPEERAYPKGGFTRKGRARVRRNTLDPDIVLPYGEVRSITLAIPDTFFTIPARLRYKGKRYKGYVSMEGGEYAFTPERRD